MGMFKKFQDRYESTQQQELTLQQYLDVCKSDPSAYATAAERLLMAIANSDDCWSSPDLVAGRDTIILTTK